MYRGAPATQVILVTKDVNLRMKAKAVGLLAEDDTTDRVKDVATLYTGHRLQEHIPSDAIEPFFHAPFEVDAEQTFALHALLDREIPLVTLSGKAGTGKTPLALAAPPRTAAPLSPDLAGEAGHAAEQS